MQARRDLPTAHEIAHALEGRPNGHRQWMAKCPAHTERTGSLSIREGHSGPLVHCFGGCSQADVIAALQDLGIWPRYDREQDREEARRQRQERDRKAATDRLDDEAAERAKAAYVEHKLVPRIWSEAGPCFGTLAETYLANRKIELDDNLTPRVLRFHPRVQFGEKAQAQFHPALLASFTPIQEPKGAAFVAASQRLYREGKAGTLSREEIVALRAVPPPREDWTDHPVALHRIALTPDAKKIGKGMALGPTGGCVIRLWPDEAVEQGLVIGEGLETTLAAAIRIEHRGTLLQPAWAAGSSSTLESFPVLDGIESLTIIVDNDASGTGQRAAEACAERWKNAGRQVIRLVPNKPGTDFADIAMELTEA